MHSIYFISIPYVLCGFFRRTIRFQIVLWNREKQWFHEYFYSIGYVLCLLHEFATRKYVRTMHTICLTGKSNNFLETPTLSSNPPFNPLPPPPTQGNLAIFSAAFKYIC
jgi:hypothetical protein